jgi:hypothetical protein
MRPQSQPSVPARLRLAVRLLEQAHGLLLQPSAARHRAALQALSEDTSEEAERTLGAIAEARLDPQVTVAARRAAETVRALRAGQASTANQLVAEALRLLRAAVPRLRYERSVRETGILIGRLWDGQSDQPMLADAWTRLPLADAYSATLTALAGHTPSVDHRALVLAYGLQQLTFALRYPPDDAPATDQRAHRAAQTLALAHAMNVLTAEHQTTEQQTTEHQRPAPRTGRAAAAGSSPATPGEALAAIQRAGRQVGEAVDAQHDRHGINTPLRYGTVWDTHHPDAAWQIMTTPVGRDGTPQMLAHLPDPARTALNAALHHLGAAISAYRRTDWDTTAATSNHATEAIDTGPRLTIRHQRGVAHPLGTADPELQPPTTELPEMTPASNDLGVELT